MVAVQGARHPGRAAGAGGGGVNGPTLAVSEDHEVGSRCLMWLSSCLTAGLAMTSAGPVLTCSLCCCPCQLM